MDGFSVSWHPRIDEGHGPKTMALRLDALWVSPILAGESPGARVEAFRVFAARGEVGE